MKELNEMSILELKGVLFDLDAQIKQIQNYAQTKVMPLIQKLEKEQNPNNKIKKEVKK